MVRIGWQSASEQVGLDVLRQGVGDALISRRDASVRTHTSNAKVASVLHASTLPAPLIRRNFILKNCRI